MRIVCLVLLHAAVAASHAEGSPANESERDALVLRGGLIEPHDIATNEETWWGGPARRLALRSALARDRPRPFSTTDRPRDLIGGVAVTCERRAGEPCGDGAHLYSELDSAAGYGSWVAAGSRVRAVLRDTRIELDRLFVRGRYSVLSAEVGRNTFAFGVSRRTQLGWGMNAPPLNHVRVSATAVEITPSLYVNAHYVVGRLRAPQTYAGNLVTIGYTQLAIANAVEAGLVQLLQLGGDGAPALGVWDFIAEHVRRRDYTAGETDSSNRRFGGNVSVRIPELANARFYYELLFEDIRRARLIDAVRYDADHLVGAELSFLTLEWYQTGVRSHEHVQRTTGFTNKGYVVGAPLGPGARSLYAGGYFAVDKLTVVPWLELAQASSDRYEIIPFGPINRTALGEDEERWRLGARARYAMQSRLWLEAEVLVERVGDFGFERGNERTHGALGASIVWYPEPPIGLAAD